MHDHGAGCRDGKLQCHRKSHNQLMPRILCAQIPVFCLRAEHRYFYKNINGTEDGGYPLRDHGCNGSSCRPHVRIDNQHQIQHHVQAGGENQKEKRHLTVADCPQVGREQVVINADRAAGTDNGDIGPGILINIRRCVHDMQNAAHRPGGQQRYHKRYKGGQQDSVCHTVLEAVHIPGSVTLAGQHRKTGREPL